MEARAIMEAIVREYGGFGSMSALDELECRIQAALDAKQREIERLTRELHDAKTQCGKNAMRHMEEYHRAEHWKAQAQWAAMVIKSSGFVFTLGVQQRVQRILEG